MTRLTICGPNLNRKAQEKGNLHVHRAGCADLRHYGFGTRNGGEEPWTIEVEDEHELNEVLYGDFASDEGQTADEYVEQFGTDHHTFPCVDL